MPKFDLLSIACMIGCIVFAFLYRRAPNRVWYLDQEGVGIRCGRIQWHDIANMKTDVQKQIDVLRFRQEIDFKDDHQEGPIGVLHIFFVE